jgi:hypothetical protein
MIDYPRAEAKDFRLLEDAIIKIYSVIRGLSRLHAESPEEKREYIRMALTLEQVAANLQKLEKKLYGNTRGRTVRPKDLLRKLRELEQQFL